MRSSLIEKERPHCLAMTANTCFSRLCRLPCHITSVGSESHATNPVALLRCTTMQVLGFVDTRDFAVHPTSENLGVVCRWEVRPLLPHRKRARAMLPDCSMEREWKVSAGAVIHRWAGNGLSWSTAAGSKCRSCEGFRALAYESLQCRNPRAPCAGLWVKRLWDGSGGYVLPLRKCTRRRNERNIVQRQIAICVCYEGRCASHPL